MTFTTCCAFHKQLQRYERYSGLKHLPPGRSVSRPPSKPQKKPLCWRVASVSRSDVCSNYRKSRRERGLVSTLTFGRRFSHSGEPAAQPAVRRKAHTHTHTHRHTPTHTRTHTHTHTDTHPHTHTRIQTGIGGSERRQLQPPCGASVSTSQLGCTCLTTRCLTTRCLTTRCYAPEKGGEIITRCFLSKSIYSNDS